MPWFKCFIHGKNFPGELIGEKQEVGFYTTRFIEAPDSESAEMLALEKLKGERKLELPEGCTPTERTMVFFEEIVEVTADEVPEIQAGFSWYVEDT